MYFNYYKERIGDDKMNFTKMHGLGNDFIVIENMGSEIKNLKELAVKLCDRHSGIGADGILSVESTETADTRMVIINSDGSEAEMCGNGIRCFSKYVYDRGIVNKKSIKIETLAGMITADILVDKNNIMSIRVDMGKPEFSRNLIPFSAEADNKYYAIELDNRSYKASTLLMGVPHTIVYTDNIDEELVINDGRSIERLSLFPSRTNVNFVQILSRTKIKLRTWERGAGLTLACGTGTCAAVVAAFINGMTDNVVEAVLPYGSLRIEYNQGRVFMEGPAEYICEGKIL